MNHRIAWMAALAFAVFGSAAEAQTITAVYTTYSATGVPTTKNLSNGRNESDWIRNFGKKYVIADVLIYLRIKNLGTDFHKIIKIKAYFLPCGISLRFRLK